MRTVKEDYLQIDILDEETMGMLREYAQGSPEIITDIIDSFEPESSVLVADIKKAIGLKDETLLKSSAHSLSGISGSIGALRLKTICSDTENSLKAGNASQAFMLAEMIFPIYEELVATLKTM
jgi:HPt (histidine-containing phosphotransfer) domain-containing protein